MAETAGVKRFFKELQGIRGIAAILVVLSHIYGRRIAHSNIPIIKGESIFEQIGGLGLTIFFCLSGFLITYLLLVEKELTGRINVRKFYMRRILRIWPLYLFVVIVGQFILPFFIHKGLIDDFMPFEHFWIKNLMYLLMLPNYVFLLFKPLNPFVDITWTIGVEEQFYLVWPQFFKRSINLIRLCIFFITLQFLSELFVYSIASCDNIPLLYLCFSKLIKAIVWSKVGYFSIGSITAVLYLKEWHASNKSIIFLMRNSYLMMCACIGIFVFFNFPFKHLILAICYSFFQLRVITDKDSANFLSNWLLQKIGKLSYGIYLFHCSVCVVFIQLSYKINLSSIPPISQAVLLYFSIIIGTILLSQISYQFFEGRFLDMKDRFSFEKEFKK